jgi:predicted nucleic acid-binding protein
MLRLLDTDIMIDILRGFPPAVTWLGSLTGDAPALIMGCRNKREMDRLLTRLEPFRRYWPGHNDYDRALASLAKGRLSHNLSPFDALIGECAVGLGAVLCTFNSRHFAAIHGLVTDRPYEKTQGP